MLRPRLAIFGFVLSALVGSFAAAAPGSRVERYLYSLADLRRGLMFPVHDERQFITISHKMIHERVEGSAQEEIIEPLQIQVPLDRTRRAEAAARLARPGRSRQLLRYFDQKISAEGAGANNAATVSLPVPIEESILGLVDMTELQRRFTRVHHHLTVPGSVFADRPGLRRTLVEQMKPFFTGGELDDLKNTFADANVIDVDQDLLPAFGRRSVTKFTKFRGPNCFHAALAFQDPELPGRPEINSKEEAGYHPIMINNDELYFALTHDFDEVDPRRERLRYGDVLVYVDVGDPTKALDWRWIKHAATYLFDDYTFSKGSNSPDTPYTVKTLDEEWTTWTRHTTHLGLKVFRYRRA